MNGLDRAPEFSAKLAAGQSKFRKEKEDVGGEKQTRSQLAGSRS
jgi:hypothetical protein